jgi:putative ABC transport system permease protein
MSGWLQDLRLALRSAIRRPGLSLVAIAGLALGLGTNVAVFSYLDFLLWAEIPARAPERLAAVASDTQGGSEQLSYPDYLDYLDNLGQRDRNRVFSDLAAWAVVGATVDTGGETVQVWASPVSGNFFPLFGVDAQLGRTLSPADDRPGAEPAIVLAAPLWRHAFAGDPGVLGRAVRVNGHPARIVGVMPDRFFGAGSPEQLYLPLARLGLVAANGERLLRDRRAALVRVTGRLRPGVDLKQAQAALQTLAAGLDRLDPRPGLPRRVRVFPGGLLVDPEARADLLPTARRIFLFVTLLLLLACANVANLLLADALERRHDLAIRVALGAGRGRLVRQMLAGSLLLALLGGAAGLGLARLGVGLIERALRLGSAAAGIGNWAEGGYYHLRLAPRVLAFALLLCIATGLLAGLLPALRITSRRRLPLAHRGVAGQAGDIGDMGDIGDTGGGLGFRRMGVEALLVVLQVAMSTWLLAGTGFAARSLWRLEHVPVGFDPRGLVLATCLLPEARTAGDPEKEAAYLGMAEEVRSLPGVLSAALSWGVPLAGWSHNTAVDLPERRGSPQTFDFTVVGLDYFATLKIPRLSGRDFERRDAPGAPRVAIVNQALAQRLFPGGESPVGRSLLLPGQPGEATAPSVPVEIVGVVADTRSIKLWERPAPLLYLPLAQSFHRLLTILARAGGPAGEIEGLLPALRGELRRRHPEVAVVDVLPFSLQLERALWEQRLSSRFLAAFGALGLTLAGLGLGSAMSFAVARRRREIGVRLALGATPGGVQSLVLGQALVQVAAGVALGLAAALAFVRLLAGLVPGSEASADPRVLLGATVVLFAVGLCATWEPARRAARIDPCTAFRAE